jgi:hypothetical protein
MGLAFLGVPALVALSAFFLSDLMVWGVSKDVPLYTLLVVLVLVGLQRFVTWISQTWNGVVFNHGEFALTACQPRSR